MRCSRSVAYSPDGSHSVSGSLDNTVRLWDASNLTGGPIATGTGHMSNVNSVAYSPDGRDIVSGSWDKTVMLWDASNLEVRPIATVTDHTSSVTSVAYSPNGSHFVSNSGSGVMLWDASNLAGGPIANGTAGQYNLDSGASTMPEGLRITFAAPPAGAVASALHAGSFLWSGCVPKATIDAAFAAQPSQPSQATAEAYPVAAPPDAFLTKRPEQLEPAEWLELARAIFREQLGDEPDSVGGADAPVLPANIV